MRRVTDSGWMRRACLRRRADHAQFSTATGKTVRNIKAVGHPGAKHQPTRDALKQKPTPGRSTAVVVIADRGLRTGSTCAEPLPVFYSGLALQNWLGPLARHGLLVAGMCGTGPHQNGGGDRAFACEGGIRNASMLLRLFSSASPVPFQNQSSRPSLLASPGLPVAG
jgi:hypothetical protein